MSITDRLRQARPAPTGGKRARRSERTKEIASHDELFFSLCDRLPREMPHVRELLLSALWREPAQA